MDTEKEFTAVGQGEHGRILYLSPQYRLAQKNIRM